MSRTLQDTVAKLPDLNLSDIERAACAAALERGGSIVEAAKLLGVTRHALKRRMIKHRLVLGPVPAQAQPLQEN